MERQKVVVAAALGECVHVAGVSNFLHLAEAAGWRTVFLGPAVSIEKVLAIARQEKADLVGVSYRLTPETGERLLGQFAEEAAEMHAAGVRFVFGGTPPVAERVRELGFFEQLFDGSESSDQVLAYLKGVPAEKADETDYPQTTIKRILWKRPYPLLRHHFGLPTIEATLHGVEKIADARALDLISLGTDQDAQENFFHPERQDPRRKGAGGVPVRTEQEFRDLYHASRRGNYPLMRCYSGTDDFIRYAEVLVETIHNAWCAIPLFWFNQMDGRGPWELEGSIREHQQVMKWYGERSIPVELNEPHHWGMRDASDVIFVVSAFLAAYNARAFGVKDYIAQLMFNSPPGLSDVMDLVKMVAILEMISGLQSDSFKIWKQTRTGLLSYPLEENAARSHLSASIYLQMALKPDIVHIVGYTEAHHAASAEDVIAASQMARRAIQNAQGMPDMLNVPEVQSCKEELIVEATFLLEAIKSLAEPGVKDAWVDAATLANAVSTGLLDAPQLLNNRFACGLSRTRIINGMSLSVDEFGHPLSEHDRINMLNLRRKK